MAELLRYNPSPSGTGNSLELAHFEHEDIFYSGQTEYAYREEYVATRGIKIGIVRARKLGLIPEEYPATPDAVLEVASNNLLPGLVDAEDHIQYVKLRGGTSLAYEKDGLKADILIGQCLFGEFGSKYIFEDGRVLPLTSPMTSVDSPIDCIQIDPRFSLYEHDSIRRHTALIQNLAKDNERYTSVTIALPRVSYYLHALEPYNAGYLSSEQTLDWCDAVDERYQAIVEALRERLPAHLECRLKSPLDVIEDMVRSAIKEGRQIQLDPFVQKLAEVDPLWKSALVARMPSSLEQFRNEYAEAIEELRHPTHNADCRIIVKNPKEERTFELGTKLTNIGKVVPTVAMYALPQIVTAPQGIGLYRVPEAPSAQDISLLSQQYS